MRLLVVLYLFAFAVSASADAYKCKDSNGRVTIASEPCKTGVEMNSARAEYIPPESQARALEETRRQREFIQQRDVERRTPASAAISAGFHDPSQSERLNRCLMAITARKGISPDEQARSKISCFSGTGLHDQCEMSIGAVAGLSVNSDHYFRAQCRTI